MMENIPHRIQGQTPRCVMKAKRDDVVMGVARFLSDVLGTNHSC